MPIVSFLTRSGVGALVLGLDEAGRGPGLGPMVLAAVALDEKAAGLLAKQGVRDSKAFGSSVGARRARAILKKSVEEMATWVGLEVCSVQAIDEYVRYGALNLLERERAVRLIERAPPCGRVVADGRNLFSPLQARYPHLEARDRGESVHVAVAAASICAKVHRDALFDEIARRYEADFGHLRGGGYVNRLTRAFVTEYVRRHGHLPPEARASWPWPATQPLASPEGPVGSPREQDTPRSIRHEHCLMAPSEGQKNLDSCAQPAHLETEYSDRRPLGFLAKPLLGSRLRMRTWHKEKNPWERDCT